MPLVPGTFKLPEVGEDTMAKAVEFIRLAGPIPEPEDRCMAAHCQNKSDLKRCAKCKMVRYCSVECQKRDWSHHKPQCASIQHDQVFGSSGDESQWDRYLRRWHDRFEISLEMAFIYGLDLYNDRSNLDNFGMVVILQPRTHPDSGARFLVKEVRVLPLDAIFKKVKEGNVDLDAFLEMWRSRRERILSDLKGTADYGLQLLDVDPEAFTRFAGNSCPLPKSKLIMTTVYWGRIARASQGPEAQQWLQLFYTETAVNVPGRLKE